MSLVPRGVEEDTSVVSGASFLLGGAMFSRKETEFSLFKCHTVFICSVLRDIQFKVKFSGDRHNI